MERAGLGGRNWNIPDIKANVNPSKARAVAFFPGMFYHRGMPKPRSPAYLDSRSQALKRLVAAKLREHPELLSIGRENLERWREEDGRWGRHTCYMLVWEKTISDGVEACCRLLEDTSEETQPLRQAAPFAGVISEKARREFLAEWENRP